ncbi:MAG: hypothetical protein BroJett003_00210 [Planctomycetota bacterium]|nr:MAG: hypothetical protein BroJett003_00210 [Planctomycetota bacterium]
MTGRADVAYSPDMAIRFLCPSCRQPIETDDEWAEKLVACPFCRATVCAPTLSTLGPIEAATDVPGARPAWSPDVPWADAEATFSGPPRIAFGEDPARKDANARRLATIAIVLAALSIATFTAMSLILAPHREELFAFTKEFQDGGSVMQAQKRMMDDLMSRPGGIPSWYVASSVAMWLGMLLWLPALILTILGMRRAAARGRAVTAMLLSVIAPMICCCTFIPW